MFVCHCAVVTDRDVLEAIANGARCVAEVSRATSAGRTCGSCVSTLRALVCQHCPLPLAQPAPTVPSANPTREMVTSAAG